MSALSSGTESDCDDGFENEDSDTSSSFEWNSIIIEPDGYHHALSYKGVEDQLISLANQKLPLRSIFKRYNLSFNQRYSNSGWTHIRLCPFKDHPEKTPSFGYHPKQDRFYCFGCQRGGKTVDFISFLEKRSRGSIAKEILGNAVNIEEIIQEATDREDDQIDQILFEYADYVRKFVENRDDKKATDFAEKLTWNLDLYLRRHAPYGSLSCAKLQARISKLKKYLDSFGENDE